MSKSNSEPGLEYKTRTVGPRKFKTYRTYWVLDGSGWAPVIPSGKKAGTPGAALDAFMARLRYPDDPVFDAELRTSIFTNDDEYVSTEIEKYPLGAQPAVVA